MSRQLPKVFGCSMRPSWNSAVSSRRRKPTVESNHAAYTTDIRAVIAGRAGDDRPRFTGVRGLCERLARAPRKCAEYADHRGGDHARRGGYRVRDHRTPAPLVLVPDMDARRVMRTRSTWTGCGWAVSTSFTEFRLRACGRFGASTPLRQRHASAADTAPAPSLWSTGPVVEHAHRDLRRCETSISPQLTGSSPPCR
jgi:hypothetical protein